MLFQILIICNVKVNVSPLKLTFSLLSFSKENIIVCKTDLFVFFYNELFQVDKIFYNHLVCLIQNCIILVDLFHLEYYHEYNCILNEFYLLYLNSKYYYLYKHLEFCNQNMDRDLIKYEKKNFLSNLNVPKPKSSRKFLYFKIIFVFMLISLYSISMISV